MPTYIGNCYELLKEVRIGLNDYSDDKLNGTVTTGAFQNSSLMRKINDAQRHIWAVLFARMPHLFLTSTSLTGTSSVYTLPSDFYKLRRFENSDKVKINPISVDEKHIANYDGNKYLYYRKGNTLVIDKDSVTDAHTLWYFKRVRDLDQGKATAGAASSITLAATARKEADYYNNMVIEDITADLTSTISDFSNARVATITGTAAANDYYGIVSELPEDFHHLIAPLALIMAKQQLKAPERPGSLEMSLFNDMLAEALRPFVGQFDSDKTTEDTFFDFEPFI